MTFDFFQFLCFLGYDNLCLLNLLFSAGDEYLHDRRTQPGHSGQDDPTEGRVRLLLQLAVAAATQVGNENNVELFRNVSLQMRLRDVEIVMLFTKMSLQMGLREGSLFCKHL